MSPSSLTLLLSLMLLSYLASVHAHLRVFNLRANDLPSKLLGTADGYVRVFCDSEDLGKTEVRKNNKNPWWSKEFNYFLAEQNHELRLEVFDSDLLFDDKLGVCQIQIQTGTHRNNCSLKKRGILYYSYTFISTEE